MAKVEKSGLGRALLRHHNQLANQSKQRIRDLNRRKHHIIESVTEVGDIAAIVDQAEEANLVYSRDNPIASVVNLDAGSEGGSLLPSERSKQEEDATLLAGDLHVPRRPPWNSKMSVEELDHNERQAFLVWRRGLARLEENERLVLTPYEKNLDIWRQLWRVLERSDLLVMVVDARDPLFYRCPDLETYALEIDEHKRTLLLINKADLLPSIVRQKWATYFHHHDILFVFWSAKAASAVLEGNNACIPDIKQASLHNSGVADMDTRIYGSDKLLSRLQSEAETIVDRREASCSNNRRKHVVVGFVGYPNVGKSSTINALVGEKRTGVTSTPGKTKHFQTLIISEKMVLCDCPGLVFPSFSSSRYEMIASGVLPIDRMTQHREVVQVVAKKVPRHVLEHVYNIRLPRPKVCESQNRAPLASELLRAYCSSRGFVSSSGLPDETRAARQILKDYVDGKLTHFEMPPGETLNEGVNEAATRDEHESCCSMTDDMPCNQDAIGGMPPVDLLNELKINSSHGSSGITARKGRTSITSSKHHKKPPRKKDRSWRVQNDDEDGMPIRYSRSIQQSLAF